MDKVKEQALYALIHEIRNINADGESIDEIDALCDAAESVLAGLPICEPIVEPAEPKIVFVPGKQHPHDPAF